MSVKRTIKTRLYVEDRPLILETLENKGCDYRFNSTIKGFRRIFDIAVAVRGRYCLGLSRAQEGAEAFFQIHCDSDYMNVQKLEQWKGDFEAQVKALQIKQQLSRNGYILTGFEDSRERIVLRIKQAV